MPSSRSKQPRRQRASPASAVLKAVLASVLDAVITMDRHGVITSWNAHAEATFGWPAAAAVGRELATTIVPPRHREAHRRGLAHFLTTGEGAILRRRIEITALHRDGHEFPVELTVTPIQLADGWHFGAVVRDITERHYPEQLQRAVYRIADAATAVAGLPEMLGAIHAIVAELLPAANLYVALYDEDAGLIRFPYWVDEQDPVPAPRPLGRGLTDYVLRTGEPLLLTPAGHPELERRGGTELIGTPSLDWIGVPLKTGERTIGVVVVQTYTEGVRYGEREKDILQFVSTQIAAVIERKRTEAQLRESETRYRLLFEANPQAMWVYDNETLRFLAVNEAAVRRYGYSRPEFLGMTLWDIRLPSEHARLQEIMDQPAPGARVVIDVRHRRKDGMVIEVEVAADSIEFSGRPASLVSVQDVTERKRLEGQLRQSQKIEAVGQLAGGIAHDFNNLLTAITGYSELLLEDLGAQDPRRLDVEEIRKAAWRAASLTQQLLAFSRKQVLQPQIIDLNHVVANAENLLRRLIGEHITLRTSLDPALGATTADPAQLDQVIVNLAVNARDAMPQGGQLLIETRNVDMDAAYAAAHAGVAAGPYVLLAVSDTGVGMDEATKARLFEPFFTTKAPGKGTGLGLSTVYGIVKQTGGFTWVYSEPGKGATFKIYLPRVAAKAHPIGASALPAEIARGTETILLVEDEPALRAVARRALERQGYVILEAPDGEAGLAIAAAHTGPLHLLLTDVVMPGLSGRDMAMRLVTSRPGLRVLYMSGYTDDAIVQHGVLEAGIQFLQKPFTPNALARKVRDVLDSAPAGGRGV
jgi:two-component system, cell cycle sensor histidine kinase and response regulator CckA